VRRRQNEPRNVIPVLVRENDEIDDSLREVGNLATACCMIVSARRPERNTEIDQDGIGRGRSVES